MVQPAAARTIPTETRCPHLFIATYSSPPPHDLTLTMMRHMTMKHLFVRADVAIEIGELQAHLTFSFARAIQEPALDIWHGEERMVAAQRALSHRASCNRAARRGEYSATMEPASE